MTVKLSPAQKRVLNFMFGGCYVKLISNRRDMSRKIWTLFKPDNVVFGTVPAPTVEKLVQSGRCKIVDNKLLIVR